MSKFSIIHPNVDLGEDVEIGEYVIIGEPPKGVKSGELPTRIGRGSVIRSHTVIYAGNAIGDNFQTGHHVLIRESNSIGHHVSIGTNSVLEHHVAIGDHVRIHSNAFIPEYSVIENHAWIGPNVVFTNAVYPKSINVKERLKGPCIANNAIIGANATILPGIMIGSDSLVGAGSVVTKNVARGSVVAGNPAKEINKIGNLPY